MSSVLVPIFTCVVLPVSIVLISALTKMSADRQRTKIILRAIEANNNIDADKLAESLRKPVKSARELLNLRLLRGCMFAMIGLALMIVGLVNYAQRCSFSSDDVSVPMMFGGASLAVGISYLIVYFVTRKQPEEPAGK